MKRRADVGLLVATLERRLWYGGNGAWRDLFMHLNGTKLFLLLEDYSYLHETN